MHSGFRWVRSGSSSIFGCALAVAGLFRVHLVHAGGSWMSLGCIGFVWFIWVHPLGHLIIPGSSGSSGCALGVGSFVLVWFLQVRPGSHLVRTD